MARGISNVQLVTIPKPCVGNRTRGMFSFHFALFNRIIKLFIVNLNLDTANHVTFFFAVPGSGTSWFILKKRFL